ncbi:MAG: NAD(P)H-dependent amine dehydrogenase family protein [Candidatus Hodarchaeales archaeon]|jgi:4-hydroxy-tetrahydrodipicolinate reductase
MNTGFNVIQVGLGPMGQKIAKLVLERENVNLLGVVDIDPTLVNKELIMVLDQSTGPGILIDSKMSALLTDKQVDVVIIATSSSLEKVIPTIKEAIEAGSNVISLCEELAYPFQFFPELSKELDDLAKANNVTVVGTGINPGYLMDLLPIVVTAPCQDVIKIQVTRMMNSAKRRVPFQKKIGTGLSTEEFKRKITNKEITGHVGLIQSIQMIVAALGMECDEILEQPPKEIIAEKEIKTPYTTVPEGFVCGLQSTAVARKKDRDVVILEFIAFAGEHNEYDSITIEGTPRITQKIIGGVHGDIGTTAMAVNLIPRVYHAPSGLLSMKDLPVPCNTRNIWKDSPTN